MADDVCRLCLGKAASLNIFTEAWCTKIRHCCSLEMSPDDGLPKLICIECATSVDSFTSFKHKCADNDQILRKQYAALALMNVKSEIKDEPDSEPDIYDDAAQQIMNPEITLIEGMLKHDPLSFYKKHRNRIVKKRPKKATASSAKQSANSFPKKSTVSSANKSTNSFPKKSTTPFPKKSTASFPKKSTASFPKKSTVSHQAKFNEACPFCGVHYNRPTKLYVHLRTHAERPYECDICGKNFKSKIHIVSHLKTHDEKYFMCEICGKMFNTARYTQRHVEEVHNDNCFTSCKICGKMVKPTSLVGHYRSHKPERRFECTTCKQKFISKGGLVNHERIHTGEKPFACRYCDSRFTMERTLRDHQRLHTGETPYHCPVCDKGFIQLSNMKSHFRNNHKGVEFVYRRKKKTQTKV